jgi:ATP-dependent DNA helicase RecG
MSGQQSKIRGLTSLGANSPDELLLVVPKGWADYRAKACDFLEGSAFCGLVSVLSYPQKHPEKSMWTFEAQADGVVLRVSFFGPHPRMTKDWSDVKPGVDMILKGVIRQFGRHLYLGQAVRVPDDLYGQVVPVYRSVPKVISGERLRDEIRSLMGSPSMLAMAVNKLHERLGEASPGPGVLDALLRSLHLPESPDDLERALEDARRLSVDGVITRNAPSREGHPKAVVPLDWFDLQHMKASLPFSLSESQEEAIEGIVQELESDFPMNALLSGDVGSGKTITYALPAVAAWKAGKRVGILAPNTPLAVQIAGELRQLFPHVRVGLITGEGVNGPAHDSILVGTTALISHARAKNWQADVLIIDEQQKFGLEQKKLLAHEATNILEATATCIPHTLGLIKHGGMRIFRLKGHAMKRIVTRVVGEQEKKILIQQLQTVIEAGDRAVIIYPQLATGEDDFRRNVLAAAERWEALFPGKVVTLHGRMKDAEKASALMAARTGEKPIVVSTSIIEVGITIPKLRLGIVVGAERYGLSTLHQMRGRLVRDGGEGYFYPYLGFNTDDPNMPDEKLAVIERLKVLEKTQDGFELAEMDAARRGFGDILNKEGAQHGKTGSVFLGLDLTPEDFARYAS